MIKNIVKTGKLSTGHTWFAAKSPGMEWENELLSSGYNGYVIFPEKPVQAEGYNGIVAYVPVHGGITYAEIIKPPDQIPADILSQDVEFIEGQIIYGFDTMHHNSGEHPIRDLSWTENQCELMARALILAGTLETTYNLATTSEARAPICQQLLDISPDEPYSFGVNINLLGGKL